MNRMRWVFVSLSVLTVCSIVSAQAAEPAPLTTPGQALDRTIANVESEFVPAAEAMPEDKYGFAPTNREFKGVRTFAQQVRHVAAVNYMIGAAILRQKPPVELGGENGPDSIKAKADIEKNAMVSVKNPSHPDHLPRGVAGGRKAGAAARHSERVRSRSWSWRRGSRDIATIIMGRWLSICG